MRNNLMTNRRRFTLASSALAAYALLPKSGLAQVVNKPSRIVVGFPPGGGTDVVARLIAEKLRGKYAANLIVDNRAGAGGRLALEHVKAAEPDGSVLLFMPDFPFVLYPHSYRKLGYDAKADFTPIAQCATTSLALSVGPMVPPEVKTVADFVQWCKANPSKAAFASTSAGATPHFVGLMFSRAAGVEMNHVPYKGGAPAVQDLIGGQIACSYNPVGEVMQYHKANRIRILATTAAKRMAFVPEVPTLAEAGYKDLVVELWLGLLGPAKMPMDVVNKLDDQLRDVLKQPDVLEALAKFGYEAPFAASADFREKLRRDFDRWAPIVKASGFTAED
jgi:tripartite-type tricarboxylate transporter receptor subunit TctC